MSADVELRWGYALGDLQRIARGAARGARGMAADFDDLYAEAFGAAAEVLYSVEERPTERDVFHGAQVALDALAHKNKSYRGIATQPDGAWGSAGSAPKFAAYWWDGARPTPSPEDRIVDRIALAQILPTLSDRQREAIAALATFDDHKAAKAALGNPSWYGSYLSLGRRYFLSLWHEGEEPSAIWGVDRRGSRPVRDRFRNTRNKRAKKGAA
jgi:hypothetical protein